MEKKNTLEELFHAYNPELGNEDDFMKRLERQMDAVEYVKRLHKEQTKSQQQAVYIAFVAGIILGGCILAFSSFFPVNQTMFSLSMHTMPLTFLRDNGVLISMAILALAISAGIVILTDMWQEISNHRLMKRKRVEP